jgi:hypothetical protein
MFLLFFECLKMLKYLFNFDSDYKPYSRYLNQPYSVFMIY